MIPRLMFLTMKALKSYPSMHTYKTCASTSEHFYTKESRLNVKRNAFSCVMVKIWNGIPQILKERKTIGITRLVDLG